MKHWSVKKLKQKKVIYLHLESLFHFALKAWPLLDYKYFLQKPSSSRRKWDFKAYKTTKMHSFAKICFVSNKGKQKNFEWKPFMNILFSRITLAFLKTKFNNSLRIIWRCSSSQQRWTVVRICSSVLLLIRKGVFIVFATLRSSIYPVIPVWSIFVWSSSTNIWFRWMNDFSRHLCSPVPSRKKKEKCGHIYIRDEMHFFTL